jgi:DnaJ-class molecular chaperone
MKKSPFEILGLPETASSEEVRSAWLSLAKIHHPDMGGTSEEFSKIATAFRDALRLSGEKQCFQCGGKGWVGVHNGFSSLKMVCQLCWGSGKA